MNSIIIVKKRRKQKGSLDKILFYIIILSPFHFPFMTQSFDPLFPASAFSFVPWLSHAFLSSPDPFVTQLRFAIRDFKGNSSLPDRKCGWNIQTKCLKYPHHQNQKPQSVFHSEMNRAEQERRKRKWYFGSRGEDGLSIRSSDEIHIFSPDSHPLMHFMRDLMMSRMPHEDKRI